MKILAEWIKKGPAEYQQMAFLQSLSSRRPPINVQGGQAYEDVLQ